MKWLAAIVREIFGLFVDDGSFAVAILVWLVLAGLAAPRIGPRIGIVPAWLGLVLFGGLAAILVASAVSRARRARGRS